jgi:hypothetical protein
MKMDAARIFCSSAKKCAPAKIRARKIQRRNSSSLTGGLCQNRATAA